MQGVASWRRLPSRDWRPTTGPTPRVRSNSLTLFANTKAIKIEINRTEQPNLDTISNVNVKSGTACSVDSDPDLGRICCSGCSQSERPPQTPLFDHVWLSVLTRSCDALQKTRALCTHVFWLVNCRAPVAMCCSGCVSPPDKGTVGHKLLLSAAAGRLDSRPVLLDSACLVDWTAVHVRMSCGLQGREADPDPGA